MKNKIACGILAIAVSLILLPSCNAEEKMKDSSLKSLSKNAIKIKEWPKKPLRGFNIKLSSKKNLEEVFKQLSAWNANEVQVMFPIDKGSKWDKKGKTPNIPEVPADNPMAPYTHNLKLLKQALDLAAQHEIYLNILVSRTVHRRSGNLYNPEDDSGYYKEVITLWEHIAKKYGNHPWLLGYNLLDEPHGKNEVMYWNTIYPRIVKAIRKIDKNTYIIVQPAPWAFPDGFDNLPVIEDEKTVYSFHFFAPHNYTHQGCGKRPISKDLVYPGPLKNFQSSPEYNWNKEHMKEYMKSALAFQKKHNVRIFVGSFAVIRWAVGADKWLADAISIFEEYGWSWSCHSLGGWNGWNPTFDAKAKGSMEIDGGMETERLKVLKQYLNRNKQD